jgi:hypothetical protein
VEDQQQLDLGFPGAYDDPEKRSRRIFDPAPGKAHRGAGDTERAAAEAIAPRTGTARWKVLVALSERPMCNEELADATGLYLYTAAPRCTELRDSGLIEDSGERRRTHSRQPSIVWRITAEGRAALGKEKL